MPRTCFTAVSLVALFVVGCATPTTTSVVDLSAPVLSIRVDSTMEPFAASFLDAAKVWEPVGGHVTLDDAAERVLACATTDDPNIGANAGDALAYTTEAGIFVDCEFARGLTDLEEESAADGEPMPPDSGVTALLAHELGHFYGLPHETTDPHGLMYPTGCCGESARLSQSDLKDWFDTKGGSQ